MTKTLKHLFRTNNTIRLMMIAILVGLVSGLGAILFFYGLEWTTHMTMNAWAGMTMKAPPGERMFETAHETAFNPWLYFFLPAIGGLIAGWLVYTFAPEAEGHGTDAMIDAFHNKDGQIRTRIPFVKGLATIVTIASGGSAGREGPIAQIGAGFGSWISRKLGLSVRERRIMLLAGTAGGLGAIFRSPLGGAITAIEVLYSEDFETEAMIPSIISSVVAYTLFCSVYGYATIFNVPDFTFTNPLELIGYLILALVCVPLGAVYTKTFYGMRDYVFRPLPIPKFMKPVLGGLGVGLLGLIIPEVYGGGWGLIQDALDGNLGIRFMAAMVLLKILSTSFTISSGGSGGVFGPTLFIGGMIGGVVGFGGHAIWPQVFVHPGSFVLVGMASYFAGVANAPIGALLMTLEMTDGYGLIAPLLLVSVIALIFTRRWSIYEKQVKDRFQSPAHKADLRVDVLEEVHVQDVMQTADIPTVSPGAEWTLIQEAFARTDGDLVQVCSDEGKLFGFISANKVKTAFLHDDLRTLLRASDLLSEGVFLHENDDLHAALVAFMESGFLELAVRSDEGELAGTVSYSALIEAYDAAIKEED